MSVGENIKLPLVTRSLLPLVKDHVTQIGNGEALNDRIRKSFDIPSPIFFELNGETDKLRTYGIFQKKIIKEYVYRRCVELDIEECDNIVELLISLKINYPKDWLLAIKLLEKTYSPSIDDFVLDWYKSHLPEEFDIEKEIWLSHMKQLQKIGKCELSSIFMAFNIRLFILCSMSAKIYGDKYLPVQMPSPFIYAMV